MPNNQTTCSTCKQCRYFQTSEQHTAGTCHRFPPVFAGENSPREDHHWRFPIVSGLSWCGEFAPGDQEPLLPHFPESP